MMIPAAIELGLNLHVLAEAEDVSAALVASHYTVGDYRDLDTLRAFAQDVDVLTFDHEHVPTPHLEVLASEGVIIAPGPAALVHAQDKLVMRAAVARLGLPNPAWIAAKDESDVVRFGEEFGWPVVVKTPRGGYDGKGVRVVQDAAQAHTAVADWFEDFEELLVESKVDFTRELSALVARSAQGEVVAWPVVESIQVNGVCDEVIAPAPDLDPLTAAAAQESAVRIANDLGVVGVMAVEMFAVAGTEPGFLINELAMRPHNSGHWTMDGAVTGQFEQHLRAVAGLPLGISEALADVCVMKNILGGENEDLYSAYPSALAAEPAAKVHTYGKSVRPGRKVGHVNVLSRPGEDAAIVRRRATSAAAIIRDGAEAEFSDGHPKPSVANYSGESINETPHACE